MGRPLRIDPIDGWHHVMNRGVDRQPIFFGDQDRVEFGRLLGVIHDEHGVDVHAYCLMGNHFHLLLNCPNGGLSAAMHQLTSVYVRHVNDRIGRDGPLFRGRFCSRLVTTAANVANVVRYVHRNPLDIRGVERATDYRWSSHRTYLGHRRRPGWLQTETVMAWFGNDPSEFEAFVSGSHRPEAASISADPAELIETIELLIAETSPSRSGPRRPALRPIAVLIAERLPAAHRTDFLEAVGITTPGAAQRARLRALAAARSRPEIDPMVDAVVSILAA